MKLGLLPTAESADLLFSRREEQVNLLAQVRPSTMRLAPKDSI